MRQKVCVCVSNLVQSWGSWCHALNWQCSPAILVANGVLVLYSVVESMLVIIRAGVTHRGVKGACLREGYWSDSDKVLPVHLNFFGVVQCTVCYLLCLLPTFLLTTFFFLLIRVICPNQVQCTEEDKDSDGQDNAGEWKSCNETSQSINREVYMCTWKIR